MKSYYILAYYYIGKIEEPQLEVKRQQSFFKERDVTGRIYISEEGINCQMSGLAHEVERYMEWLKADPRFSSIDFKIHHGEENVFPRMTVKYRKKLVAIDCPVDFSVRGEHVSPKEWRQMIESGKDYLMIDVRNDYESQIGHFEGAILPPCNTFREFEGYLKELKETKDPSTTEVMMYCTGGIRCELYSAIMMKEGFSNIFQLDGGVIKYGLQEGSAHWKGKLFVFDDRLAIPISDSEPAEVIAQCHCCHCPEDTYYNCANMDCNALFISCSDCLHKLHGCCQEECEHAPRVRPYHANGKHKPFRRLHTLQS